MKKMKHLYYLLIIIILCGLSGCSKDEYKGQDLELNVNAKISSFTIGNTQGIINDSNATINIVFPFGFNRTSVSPKIELPTGTTIMPLSGAIVNLTNPIKYKVSAGNIYNNYTVNSSEQPAILEFDIAGTLATIDETTRTISATVPVSTDITSVTTKIKLADGATITPNSGITQDFTSDKVYIVKKDTATVYYTVSVKVPETIAFLGVYNSAAEISNADEKAAWNWLSSTNSLVQYVSFNAIKNGTIDLSQFKVLWWHEDATQTLPTIASDASVKTVLKNYNNNGGNFLLTSFAALYLDAISIVPSGKGPNNSWSNNPVWVEPTWSWGISYTGHADHPVFAGLTQTSDKSFPTTYLLASGCFRHNNTSQWHIGTDWGGFNTITDWRNQTGGIDLGGTEGDEYRSNQVTMAEFPKSSVHGATIAIGAGCYDWYSEADPSNSSSQPSNIYLPNIQKLTNNVLSYLSKQ